MGVIIFPYWDLSKAILVKVTQALGGYRNFDVQTSVKYGISGRGVFVNSEKAIEHLVGKMYLYWHIWATWSAFNISINTK